MNFKLPSIHHLTNQNKKVSDENPTKYIHVLKGYAFVNNELIAVVNLRDYIKTECNIYEEDQISELDDLLDWFEGKSFTQEFWKQLTSEKIVSLEGDSLLIEDASFSTNLHYQSVEVDIRNPIGSIASNIDLPDFNLFRVSFSGKDLDLLNKTFKNELKKDHLNFEFSESGKPVKFCFSTRNYIFGSIKSTMNSASELMAFLENKSFKEILDEHLQSLPPLPPDKQEENQESSFDPGEDDVF